MNRLAPTHVGALMLGALVLVFGVGAFKLGFWMDEMPGPGLLPMAAAVLLVPTIAVMLREPAPAEETPFTLTPPWVTSRLAAPFVDLRVVIACSPDRLDRRRA